MSYFELKGKNVFYVIGAFGSGKSRLVNGLAKQWNIFTVHEDSAMRHLLASKKPNIQIYSYISTLFYNMVKHFQWPHFIMPPILVVDGHPRMSYVYQKTFEHLDKSPPLNSEKAYEFYWEVKEYMKETLMKDANEFVIYLNIPFEKNWEFVQKRWKEERYEDFKEELDKLYLGTVRSYIGELVENLGLPIIEITDPDYDFKELHDKIIAKAS